MKQDYRLALVGFGTVGQGLAEILRDKGKLLAQRFGASFTITAVATARRGAIVDPAGLAPAQLLEAIDRPQGLGALANSYAGDVLQLIAEAEADVLVETTWTDLSSGEPATSYIRHALEQGMHVVTANKGPIALHYRELAGLAAAKDCTLGIEGTVMAGTPALRLGWSALAGCAITEVSGIFNGTTNFILSAMEEGQSYEQALREAQRLGYAEADPAGDVEGHDAAAKVAILANVLLDADIRPSDVECQGITALTTDDLRAARAAGKRWKLIGTARRNGGGLHASVRPQQLPLAHPLASVSGTTNAISFETDLLGPVTLVGSGAGRSSTGFALLSDLLAIHRRS